MTLRFLTAGESHGPELVATVEGVPAGFDIDLAAINADLARRQKGYGRGGRMLIEKDEVRPVSGIRFGKSLGSPITFIIENRDFKNWVKKMSADPGDRGHRAFRGPEAYRPSQAGPALQQVPAGRLAAGIDGQDQEDRIRGERAQHRLRFRRNR